MSDVEIELLSQEIENFTKTERTFLHDISNHLVVAQGMGTFTLKKLKNELEDKEDKKILRLEKSIHAIEKIIDLVRVRRLFIHEHDKK